MADLDTLRGITELDLPAAEVLDDSCMRSSPAGGLLGLNQPQFGLLILTAAAGSIAATFVNEHLEARLGRARTLTLTIVGMVLFTRTSTGRLPSASRSVTSQHPPCRHGAQAAGRSEFARPLVGNLLDGLPR